MSKVWLVSGAGRGLGLSIGEAALAAGDRLVAGARDPAQLAKLVERYADRIHPVPLDVTDEAAAARAVATAMTVFGRLDVLVNNAGYAHTAPFEQLPPEDFRDQVETNLFGVVNLTRAALPVMRAQRGGHVFQISSVGGRVATPGLSAYQAAKWAVGGFTDVVAREVAHLGIQMCTLEPGGMRTAWAMQARRGIDDMLPDYQASVGQVLKLLNSYGGHEIGDPAKIAALIVNLSRRQDLPSRLLLGADALHVCGQAEARRAEDLERWRETSLSVHFDGAQLPAELKASGS
jgi:NAD(P)-dependent dehydrogenase (short-subunit alcohol dehydrogenase family)